MDSCKEFAHNNPKEYDPKAILRGAWEASSALTDGTIDGSCTACVVTLVLQENHNLELHCANVGDSGYVMVRKNQGMYRSKPQLYAPNKPFQLGSFCDTPNSAQQTSVILEPGDVISVCTDGTSWGRK